MTERTPEEIAAVLTEAQRKWLRWLPANRNAVDRRSVEALIRLGLAEDAGTVPNPHMPAWPYLATRCTPLGLAVRTLIEQESRRG